MRMSCSGCRVLRKGCSEDCTIRPCLQWIKNPESQSNATVFLAKFYGRAGLMNLINAGPDHLRPATFKSLLYEACGRIVNPIYGSVGLIWSGNWQLCQNAVDAVLKGNPITQIAADAAETSNGPPLKAYDIRHVTKDETSAVPLHRVRYRCRFKRSVGKPKSIPIWAGSGDESGHDEFNRSTSHDSSLSDQSEMAPNVEGVSRETESLAYMKTADPEFSPKQTSIKGAENGEIELELTLGFEPMLRSRSVNTKRRDLSGGDDGVREMELGL